MAPHDDDEDPAVYRSGPSRQKVAHDGADVPDDSNLNGKQITQTADANETSDDEAVLYDEDADIDDAEGEDMEDDEHDDGTLLTVQPGFNRLLLVLRDERVMRFVKYVSAAAEGSRWDICGEYEVGLIEEEEEEEEE